MTSFLLSRPDQQRFQLLPETRGWDPPPSSLPSERSELCPCPEPGLWHCRGTWIAAITSVRYKVKPCLTKLFVATQRDLKVSSQVGYSLERTPQLRINPDNKSRVFGQAKRVFAKQIPYRRNSPGEGEGQGHSARPLYLKFTKSY